MGLEYTAVPDVEDQDAAPARSASTVSRVTVVGAVVCGLALGSLAAYGGVFRSGAAPAAFAAVHTPTAVDGGMGTIGAMNVAVCTSATADATSDCWENYGGICMYKESSCASYGGSKNSSGCGSGKCFCCQSIDSSLIGDDDAVLAYVDSYIGDDDKRSRSGKKTRVPHDAVLDEVALAPGEAIY